MNLFHLLGLPLKSDEIVEVLEYYDVAVIYDFDRLNENSPDAYWASSMSAGFELRFNEHQTLSTIFLYALSRHNFKAIEPSMAGVPFYQGFAEAQASFEAGGIPFRTSSEGQSWIKGHFGDHQVHYEFNKEGALALVTIMAANA